MLQVLEPTFIEDVDEQDIEHEDIFAFFTNLACLLLNSKLLLTDLEQ